MHAHPASPQASPVSGEETPVEGKGFVPDCAEECILEASSTGLWDYCVLVQID